MTVAFWCLFAAALLHLITKAPLFLAQNRAPGGYDNKYPRDQQAALTGWGRRAHAAHENQIESFPLFAAGVLVSSVAGVESQLIAYLAITFVIVRLAYFYFYLANKDAWRTPVWAIGFLCSLGLLCSPAWA